MIADVARTGNSGSGVFDVQRRCLLGHHEPADIAIQDRSAVSADRDHDIAKYFVPAAEIAAFLPPKLPVLGTLQQ